MRHNLVTTFHCTECRSVLNLAYQADLPGTNEYRDDGITGAAKVDNRIYVEPCQKCVGEARLPLVKMREALATITNGDNT